MDVVWIGFAMEDFWGLVEDFNAESFEGRGLLINLVESVGLTSVIGEERRLGGVFGRIRERPDGGRKSGLISDSGTGTSFVAACSGLDVSVNSKFNVSLTPFAEKYP